MTGTIDTFVAALDARLDVVSRGYASKAMRGPVRRAEREIPDHLLDVVGRIYLLWGMAAQKTELEDLDEKQLRAEFLANLRRRLHRNDRGTPEDQPGAHAPACMTDLEVLAMDAFEFATQIRRRLHPIARAVETARWMGPMRGRRGGGCDARSSG